MDKIIVITGPTASGKTRMAIEVAKRTGGEIISADSVQIYRRMDIGSAKPDEDEREGIPHHIIDCVEPGEPFTVADYQRLACAAIDDICARGKTPILAGGTGLYINAVLYPLQFTDAEPDEAYREELRALEDASPGRLHAMLAEVDPQSAARLHANDTKRLVRALEVFKLTGRPMGDFAQDYADARYDALRIGLTRPRDALYEGIDRRVDGMMRAGLLNEVVGLLESGVKQDSQAMQAIGYKELAQYLLMMTTLTEAVEQIKQNTRRYAKRQLTWLRRDEDMHWFDSGDYASFDDMLENIVALVKRHLAGEGTL